MNVELAISQTEHHPFANGHDLWVVIDNPDSKWWKEIDFNTSFLLSSLTKHKTHSFTRSVSNETEHILAETQFPKVSFKSNSKLTFVGTENHFFNRWICLVESADDINSAEFISNIKNLNCNNIRFFFDAKLSTGLLASFPNCQFISSSH